MGHKIKLNKSQIDYLLTLPEQGMGYQVVDILLKSGIALEKRIVLNSSYLALENNENINPDDIDLIKLH